AAMTAAAVPAFAADLPVPAAPYYPKVYVPPVYSWSGLYLGGHAGLGILADSATNSTTVVGLQNAGTRTNINTYGFISGVQVGANYQMGHFVVGVEGTWDATDLSGSASITTLTGPGTNERATSAPDYLVTAAGRVGYAWNEVLFFAKGGGAWLRARY